LSKPVLVAGAGSWGTVLAIVLARNNHKVFLWDKITEHIVTLQKERCNNQFLPGTAFPETLEPVTDFFDHLDKIQDIIIAVPCNSLRDVLSKLGESSRSDFSLCLACKGFEAGTQLLNHQVVKEYLDSSTRIAVLSGPSFAIEVAQGLPTAVTIASEDNNIAEHFANYFHNEFFRTYTHDDIIGVQVGGAVKNVMAIAAGISDGLGFGANSRAALITRGLVEIIRFGLALGARQETFMGLAGLGDLVLTCTDNQSRNRRLGLCLAEGKSLEQARIEIGQAIEGIQTAEAVIKFANAYNIEMPITEQVNKVISGQRTPREAVQALLARDQKQEIN